jgi:hypothetical protein
MARTSPAPVTASPPSGQHRRQSPQSSVSSRNRSCGCESPALRRTWLNRSVGSSKRVWIRCRRYRVRHGRWVRCGGWIHSSTRQRFRFERFLDRRRWGRLGYRRSRCWRGRWPNRCVGGIGCSSWGGMGHRVRIGPYARASSKARRGYRGSYSETNLPVDYVLVVLLAHDQGAQYADDGHRDHQTDQQELIRTRPPKIHLTPPARAPRKLTNTPVSLNHMHLSEVPKSSIVIRAKSRSRDRQWMQQSCGECVDLIFIVPPRPHALG